MNEFNEGLTSLQNGDENVEFRNCSINESQATMFSEALTENTTTQKISFFHMLLTCNNSSILTALKEHKHLNFLSCFDCDFDEREMDVANLICRE
eukprot:TRINITY_DN14111_c0_g1_i1.p1 TRINITY_DN14111_c0_g1~~TRINITY_DN14111_c0_g1_i1.p1  ORF type:complete len:109 (-),score=26.68 TRINITY_DN14111_c0_g1_i1:218-502(-)